MSATSRRADFFDMPDPVIAAVADAIGSRIVATRGAVGGFSPGPAGRCRTADGGTVFVKACSDQLSPFATAAHRREASILALLPTDHPSPALVATVELDGWFVLITEYIAGQTPIGSIDHATTEEVLRLVTDVAEAGTPSPIDLVPAIGDDPEEVEDRKVWTEMVAGGLPADLDRWSHRHASALAELEADWIEAASGDSLLHRDLRPDNMVLNPSGGVAVDWPGASRGAAWVDLVGLLPSLVMLGGPHPQDVFSRHPVGRGVDRAAVDCYLALLTGYFVGRARQPPIPNVPGLRRFQADQASVCREWISLRLGWDPPEAGDRVTVGR